jgi:hypothetical protein
MPWIGSPSIVFDRKKSLTPRTVMLRVKDSPQGSAESSITLGIRSSGL